MKAIESYNNICISLDMAKNHLERFTEQRKYCVRLLDSRKPKDIAGQSYSGMPKGCRDDTTLDEIMRIIQELDNHIFLQEENIRFFEERKKETEDILKKLDGVHYKVYYLNKIKGMSLWRISEELNYSISYIEKISAEIGKCVQ